MNPVTFEKDWVLLSLGERTEKAHLLGIGEEKFS